jgi:Carboxypeptidase regulatory-like domain/TonB-dependent Receptor Plug Domain
MMSSRIARLMVMCTALLAVAAPSHAQVSTGRIDAAIVDSTGAVLPGVTVDISGPESHSAVTDNLGEAHFLNLAPGTYTVGAKLSGFSDYLNKSVIVGTGASVPLKISMGVAGVSTQVQVTSDTPIVDTKKMTASTNVSVEELQNIPSSRDPWVVLQTVPGVIVDRVNVGGAESGQQSNYMAKGAIGGDNTWNIDGIAVTDMAATGSTPTYYDFDMFQEMQVSTGGADITSTTPGVQLNMVLKSGSNTPHGSTRIYFENEDMQSNNMSADLASALGSPTGKGNRTHQYKDYGFELGGPLVKDRLWAWGAVGKTHVDLRTILDTPDRTELQDTSFKATGQVSDGIRANFTYFRGNKEKFGRGASATRPPETTYDQTGPTPVYKGEANFVIKNNLFLSAKAATTRGGFSLTAEGGADKNIYIDDGGVFHNTLDTYTTKRPQSNVSLDANTFKGHHELKFGFGWRKAEVTSTDAYPGNGIITTHIGYPDMLAGVIRDFASKSDTVYTSAYFGDTWTNNRLTANLGLRWDRQAGSLGAASTPANVTFPDILPAATATPLKDAIVWNSVMPRIGLTYALTPERKTIVRGTYAMFASQMGSAEAGVVSTIQTYTNIYYYAIDLNGNRVADKNEILTGLGNVGYTGFDPANPTKLESVNKIGDYTTPRAQEISFGIDHELMPNFGVSATYTWRYYDKFDWRGGSLTGVNASNYTQTGSCTPSSSGPCSIPSANDVSFLGSYNVPYYALNANAVPAGAGRTYEERKGYHQRYMGLELAGTKRMSNHWMARFGFSTNSHREYMSGADALDDPTPSPANPRIDGGLVVTQTGGSGKSNIYLVLPQYQFIANGLYQAKWGINLGANWVLRQGYAEPYFRGRVNTGDPLGTKSVLLVSDVGEFRLPAVSSLDARIEKAFRIQRSTLALDLDIFNITNASTVLGRQFDARLTGATGFNKTLEIMNPRILRLGARFTF